MNPQRLYNLNSLCALILCGVLSGAFVFQYGLGENPCPLCLLQRMGMLGVILGLSLNTFFGFDPRHFSFVILAALVGGGFSTRQVLLHIAPKPGEPLGYGSPFLGMHLYTWGVLIFFACIVGAASFLFVIRTIPQEQDRSPSSFEKFVFGFAALLCTVNVIGTVAMCQFGPCCENGPCP